MKDTVSIILALAITLLLVGIGWSLIGRPSPNAVGWGILGTIGAAAVISLVVAAWRRIAFKSALKHESTSMGQMNP